MVGILMDPLRDTDETPHSQRKHMSDIWAGIVFIVGMSSISLLSLQNHLQPEPIEIIEKKCEGEPIKYEFGEVGIKAFQDEDGTVFVVSCFQGEGDTVTACWDKRFTKEL